jgi:pimeloyl-ACP methyl ester carboxylesterase
MQPRSSVFCALALVLHFAPGAASVSAAEKLDLERETPVPADQTIPIVDFFRNPAFRDPEVNRGGTHVAAMVSGAKDQTDLFVFELENKKLQLWSAPADRDVLNLNWLDDSRLVFTVGKENVWTDGVLAANTARASEPRALFQQCQATLVGIPDADRLQPLYWVSGHIDAGDRKKGGVVRVNTELNTGDLTGWGDKIPSDVHNQMRIDNTRHVLRTYPLLDGEFTVRYLADQAGELAFAVNNSASGIETLHRFTGEKWESCSVDLDRFEIIGPGHKAGELVVRGPSEEGKPQPLQFLDTATGQPGAVLLTDEAYDFNGWIYRHPDSHEILGASFQRNGPRVAWFNDAYRALQKTLDAAFTGLTARILSSDIAEKNFFIGVSSDRQPVVYYRFNAEQKSITPVKASRPWIDPARMRPISMFKYKTAEGRSIDAYVTLPAGASKDNPAPLVVLPHDGPRSRSTWEFHAEAQFLASRGYAVLQPNYRGSIGYDWMFPYEHRWAYRKMHDDVTAATKTLLGTGLIDRSRVAIMGTGFGAYLALSGAVHEPNLYRCAVTISGIFDWERRMADEKYNQFNNPSYAVMRRWLGDPETEKARFEEISPLRHFGNTRVPTLVFHGREDAVPVVNQARALIGELNKHDVPHEVVVLGGERYALAYLKNRVELYARIAAFLQQHLAARPAAAN